MGRRLTPRGLCLALPAGKYKAEWVNLWTGAAEKAEAFDHPGGPKEWRVPPCKEGLALRVKRAEAG